MTIERNSKFECGTPAAGRSQSIPAFAARFYWENSGSVFAFGRVDVATRRGEILLTTGRLG